MLDAGDDAFPVARKAVNAGAGVKQFLRHAAPGNAGRADNQRYDFHVCLPISPSAEFERVADGSRDWRLSPC